MSFMESFDGTRIHYIYHKGKKDALFFLHGWPLNHTFWDKEVKYFRNKNFSTVAIDLRGHGRSDKPRSISAYNLKYFARDIVELMNHESIEKPILVGHSFGGVVLLKFVEMFYNFPKALVLMDTTYENPLKDIPFLKHFRLTPFTLHLLNYILKHRHVQKKHFKEVEFSRMKDHKDLYYWLKGAEQTPFFSLVACLKDMLKFNEKNLLHRIKKPTLIIEGEMDNKTPANIAFQMNERIPNSQLMILEKASHDTNIRNPREVNKIIYSFVSNI